MRVDSTAAEEITALAAAISAVSAVRGRLEPDELATRLHALDVIVQSDDQLGHILDWTAVARERITLSETVGTILEFAVEAFRRGDDTRADLYRELAQVFEAREKIAAEKLQQYIDGTIPEPA